jgi:hypothetical protein
MWVPLKARLAQKIVEVPEGRQSIISGYTKLGQELGQIRRSIGNGEIHLDGLLSQG